MMGESVRLYGILREFDAAAQIGTLLFQDASIQVNTMLVDGAAQPIVAGTKYHMIGELESSAADAESAARLRLRVRVVCNAEGLDAELYVRAVELQRECFGVR
eukprot:FR736635.1.p2 GENE.FR736635.1~~FR736635.1.p2  ORF type:complete len:113 (+),score=11.34 FR736635.1:31-339(+)